MAWGCFTCHLKQFLPGSSGLIRGDSENIAGPETGSEITFDGYASVSRIAVNHKIRYNFLLKGILFFILISMSVHARK